MRYRSDPESAIQARVVKLFRLAGCKVYPTSQYRVSRQAVGMADLYVVHPARGAWWWECKSDRGSLNPAQLDFAKTVRACGVEYGWGDYDDALALLVMKGLVAPQVRSA